MNCALKTFSTGQHKTRRDRQTDRQRHRERGGGGGVRWTVLLCTVGLSRRELAAVYTAVLRCPRVAHRTKIQLLTVIHCKPPAHRNTHLLQTRREAGADCNPVKAWGHEVSQNAIFWRSRGTTCPRMQFVKA